MKRMRDGYLTIVTSVDGTETRFSTKAEMEIAPLSAVLCYNDADANVTISLRGNEAVIERCGDYSMRLCLREGEDTNGTLSIAGSVGEVKIFTERLAYSISKSSILLQMYYTLIFGEEKQNMRLRINASQSSLEER